MPTSTEKIPGDGHGQEVTKKQEVKKNQPTPYRDNLAENLSKRMGADELRAKYDILLPEGSKLTLPRNLKIPKISDEKLMELYEKTKPIVSIGGKKYRLKEFNLHDLRWRSYLYDTKNDKRDEIDTKQLENIGEFLCLHTYGYYGWFKPSIAEVLSQAPSKTIKKADAFEIIKYTDNLVNEGYHLSFVRLYKIKEKENTEQERNPN